jgi:DNA mismatch repair protein MutL
MVKTQEPVATTNGTSIAMKNLFFNVPARRNFLKSNAAEMRHIVDEFMRVALAFPGIFFSLTGGNQQIFHLEKGSLKQRIVQVLGQHYNARLVTVQEKTDYLNIYGFVGKPDTAKKTRGDQYFFVNNRFIRSAYLNHAVMSAFKDMIPADSFPLYALFIDLDPAQLDINVHPTKQEIKFEDEKIVYAFVQAAVKHALAQFSITPTLEFDLDPNIQKLDALNKPFTDDKKDAALSSDLAKDFTHKNSAHFIQPTDKGELRHWKDFFEPNPATGNRPSGSGTQNPDYGGFSFNAQKEEKFESLLDKLKKQDGGNDTQLPMHNYAPYAKQLVDDNALLFQLHGTYIVAPTARGYMLIHQQLAHERILYERFAAATNGKSIATQRSLFPVTLQLSAADAVLLQELTSDLHQLGYHIEPFGTNAFVIQGTPADVGTGNEKLAIESLLEQFKHFSSDLKFSRREKLIRSLAWQQAIKPGTLLALDEMRALTTDLFKCAQPNVTASGNPTYIEFKKDYLEQLFKR